MNSTPHKNNFWIGFFLGGLIGGFIIFLLGTKEGKKLIEKLIEKTEEYEEDIEDKVSTIQKKGDTLLSEVETVKEEVLHKVEDGKKATTESIVSKMDEALSRIEELQKKGMSLTEEVHRNYFKKNGRKLVS
jgi:gas vesicle protein